MRRMARHASPVDFGLVGAAEDVIDADVVEIAENQQGFRRGQALAGLKLGQQGLIDAGGHLQSDLRHALFLAQKLQVGFHVIVHLNDMMSYCILTNMTVCHILKASNSKLKGDHPKSIRTVADHHAAGMQRTACFGRSDCDQ